MGKEYRQIKNATYVVKETRDRWRSCSMKCHHKGQMELSHNKERVTNKANQNAQNVAIGEANRRSRSQSYICACWSLHHELGRKDNPK